MADFNTIYGSKSIKIEYPNGRETWVRGNAYTIKWSYIGNPEPDVRIQLLKNGSVVGNVTSSTTNSAYKDTSNNNFTIE
jgi:hypothetical protein